MTTPITPIRLNEQDRADLIFLAELNDLNKSNVIRALIRQAVQTARAKDAAAANVPPRNMTRRHSVHAESNFIGGRIS